MSELPPPGASQQSSELPAVSAAAGIVAPPAADAAPDHYLPRVACESEFVLIRGLRYHLRIWHTPGDDAAAGPAGADAPDGSRRPLLLLLHGWMDVSASFQFVVDELQKSWRVAALDWRGFGLSEGSPGSERAVDSYAFADYLGDLDAVLDHLSPHAPVRIVAHSMGGNVAMLYAGIRPERVAGLVNLEGFGLRQTESSQAVGRYRSWLDQLKQPAQLRPFASLDEVAARLIKTNPRLPVAKARFLAEHWARPLQPGQQGYALRADPAHKRVNPVLYRVDEALACWAAIEAPVLWIASDQRDAFHEFTRTQEYRRRLTVIRRLEEVEVADAGHMLHHDQPARIAALIEEFFSR